MTLPVMIFAAGFGTRMGGLTQDCPKPLLPVAGRAMIDRTIDLARDAGAPRIVANTHYLGQMIADHLSTADVLLSHEAPGILDTGGGLKKAAEKQAGKKVKASFVESFSKDTTPRDLDDLLRMEYRTKLLNPKWAEAMVNQGSGGAFEVSQRMPALIG